MKIGTYRSGGRVVTVLLEGDELVEVASSLEELLAGPGLKPRAVRRHHLDPSRLGPAVAAPGKVLCVGRNYVDHVSELGNQVPERGEIFVRTRTSLAGPYEDVLRPALSEQMDYEAELAVVVGRGGRHIRPEDALDHVGGYAAFNDISLRDYQNFGRQWTPGKNFDRTGPLGPFVVTPDEVGDPHQLEITCEIESPGGGRGVMQSANTRQLIRRIPELIAYITEWTTLEPGDVIATGTPGGVGFGRRPYRWLKTGEVLVTTIERVGQMRNRVVDEEGRPPSRLT